MTALEYMEKQVKKHRLNLERESARGACAEALNHIFAKICYYEEAVDALRKVGEVVKCKDCEYRHDSCFAGDGNTYCDIHHKYFPLDRSFPFRERRTDERKAD